MTVFAIILAIACCLSMFLNVELWKTAKELKEELEFAYGEHQSVN